MEIQSKEIEIELPQQEINTSNTSTFSLEEIQKITKLVSYFIKNDQQEKLQK